MGILVDRVCRVMGGLIDDEQGGFRAGVRDLEKVYGRVNRETFWQVWGW